MTYDNPQLSPQDAARLRFIKRLYLLEPKARTHLLRIENDDEIAELKRVSIDQQHFEMAVAMKDEQARRKVELAIPPESVSNEAEYRAMGGELP